MDRRALTKESRLSVFARNITTLVRVHVSFVFGQHWYICWLIQSVNQNLTTLPSQQYLVCSVRVVPPLIKLSTMLSYKFTLLAFTQLVNIVFLLEYVIVRLKDMFILMQHLPSLSNANLISS